MDECPVCEHAQCAAIEASIGPDPKWNVLACRWRIAEKRLRLHAVDHMSPIGAASRLGPIAVGEQAPVALREAFTENPLDRFKQAWSDAHDDGLLRNRMIAWLNDQLQADDMGL
jgi:hypothetical protein